MRKLNVFNQAGLIEDRLKNKLATPVAIFRGSAKENLASTANTMIGEQIVVEMPNSHWEGSEGYHTLWAEIGALQKKAKAEMATNAAQAPSPATLQELVQKYFIDIARRAQESPDLTSMIATEVTDFEFPETVNVRNLLDYVGKMEVISGTNDSVPLIEQNFGNVDTFGLEILGIGWKDSLKNMLYNTLHTLEKVNRAVVAADTDARNARTVGVIVGATYVASQKQAADSTANATYDAKMYNTMRKAIKLIRGLKDPLTKSKIAVPSLSLLVNSADSWDIERVINGQLGSGNGTVGGSNMASLPIDNIIEYDHGITHGKTWGKKILNFPGVKQGKAYLFVPRETFLVANKRPITMETGNGETLQLSTEERAWYRVQGEWYKDFLGSSYPSPTIGAGYGYVIEITLPTEA